MRHSSEIGKSVAFTLYGFLLFPDPALAAPTSALAVARVDPVVKVAIAGVFALACVGVVLAISAWLPSAPAGFGTGSATGGGCESQAAFVACSTSPESRPTARPRRRSSPARARSSRIAFGKVGAP
jgi:hypothetical protein